MPALLLVACSPLEDPAQQSVEYVGALKPERIASAPGAGGKLEDASEEAIASLGDLQVVLTPGNPTCAWRSSRKPSNSYSGHVPPCPLMIPCRKLSCLALGL